MLTFEVFYLSMNCRKGLYLMGTQLSVYVKGFLKNHFRKRIASRKYCEKSLNSENLVAGIGKYPEEFNKTFSHTFEMG